jgi:hypothetical protein
MGNVEPRAPNTPPDEDVLAPFAQAYFDYLQVLQPAFMSPEYETRGTVAQQEYLQELQKASQVEAQQRMMEAWSAYVQAAQAALASEAVRDQAAEAYKTYLAALKQAWAQVDLQTLDPHTLAAITRTMVSATWMAAAAAGIAEYIG